MEADTLIEAASQIEATSLIEAASQIEASSQTKAESWIESASWFMAYSISAQELSRSVWPAQEGQKLGKGDGIVVLVESIVHAGLVSK